jgi:signal transduction histidine kinase
VSESSLIERLAALPSLASIPRDQLEWLVAHGEVRNYPARHVLATKGQAAIADLWLVLSGRISIRLDQNGIARTFKEWTRGDLTGLLPYSRLSKAVGDVQADEPLELFVVPNAHVKEMTRTCYEFTALCVHVMVDRARDFKSQDLVVQKLASLGVLSAGIAHELNNPSSALARSAKELASCRVELVEAARALGAAGLSAPQLSSGRKTQRRPTFARRSIAPTVKMPPRHGSSPMASMRGWRTHSRSRPRPKSNSTRSPALSIATSLRLRCDSSRSI